MSNMLERFVQSLITLNYSGLRKIFVWRKKEKNSSFASFSCFALWSIPFHRKVRNAQLRRWFLRAMQHLAHESYYHFHTPWTMNNFYFAFGSCIISITHFVWAENAFLGYKYRFMGIRYGSRRPTQRSVWNNFASRAMASAKSVEVNRTVRSLKVELRQLIFHTLRSRNHQSPKTNNVECCTEIELFLLFYWSENQRSGLFQMEKWKSGTILAVRPQSALITMWIETENHWNHFFRKRRTYTQPPRCHKLLVDSKFRILRLTEQRQRLIVKICIKSNWDFWYAQRSARQRGFLHKYVNPITRPITAVHPNQDQQSNWNEPSADTRTSNAYANERMQISEITNRNLIQFDG